ncbi:MAG: alanine racemase [Mariprofundales bacterium]
MQLPSHIQNKILQIKSDLADHQPLNVYIYDTDNMYKRITELTRLMPKGVQVFYAMKANPHAAFLKAARNAVGIEIASLGEAERALAAGFVAQRLIYTGPGKSAEELRWSVANGVRTIHIESLLEAYRLDAICAELGKTQDILLRINTDFAIHGAQTTFSGGSMKFGVDEELLPEVMPQILSLQHIKFRGLHVYAASGVLQVGDLLENCRRVFQIAKQIEQDYLDIRCDIIDFGGGFGIDYLETGQDFSPTAYAQGLQFLIDSYDFTGRSFVLELGRYLAADCGWFCSEILDIKTSRAKKQVICAGGINHFRRPAALRINHPLAIVRRQQQPLFSKQEKVRHESVYIGGPLCTSADKLANDIHIDAADVGDIAVFGLAGAYGLSMSNIEFLSHSRPEEVS